MNDIHLVWKISNEYVRYQAERQDILLRSMETYEDDTKEKYIFPRAFSIFLNPRINSVYSIQFYLFLELQLHPVYPFPEPLNWSSFYFFPGTATLQFIFSGAT